jgi:hypothetical protein
MQEVKVESLEKLELSGDGMRISANSGALDIIFPREIWNYLLASAPTSEEPDVAELDELAELKDQLKAFAEEHSFKTIREAVRCGGSAIEYDLVLRPAGLFAVTTGYHFAPVVGRDLMEKLGACLEEDESVEQAYAIGAVASEKALAAGDENLKVLSMRRRRCSISRFEMAPELWQVLSERLGWENVETFVNERGV